VTTERVGRYKEAFSSAQIQLIEEFFANALTAIGYEPSSKGACILSREEKLAREQGHRLYQRMRSGAVRRRLRAKAKLRLLLCRGLGPVAPLLLPRLAVTSLHWQERAASSLSEDALAAEPSASLRHVS